MNNKNEITSTSRSVKVSKRQSNARFRLLTVFAVLLCLLFGGKAWGQTTIFSESFNSSTIPTDWTQEQVSGTVNWTFVQNGNTSHPSSDHTGSSGYFARYFSSTRNVVNKLKTPLMNLSSYSSATLTFWLYNELWLNDQDVLKVYYKVNNGSWIQIGSTYNTNITTWTQYTISLPNLAANYQIAFEGTANYGYGVSIDDVTITGTPACISRTLSFASGTSSVAIGSTITRAASPSAGSGTVTYSSSDPGIASVNSSGVITGVHTGSATITASITEADGYCSATNTYNVTVVCPTVATPSASTPVVGCGSATLTATPSSGCTIDWYTESSGGSIVSGGANTNSLTVNSSGNYYAQAKLNADNTCVSSRKQVTATVHPATIGYTGLAASYSDGASVSLTLTGYSSSAFSWTSNYGGSGTGASVSGTAHTGLSFHATASEHGCSGSVDIPITLNETSGGSAADCGPKLIYVSTTGSDSNNGSSTAPVKTVSKALTLATGGTASNPVVIRVASGTYNIDAPLNLISNVIIDGQWDANTTSGVWTKGTTATIINRTATSPEGGTTMPRITAIECNGISNFKLQDIKITTSDAPAYSLSTGYFGVSTYAVHLSGCSNYKFIRCQLNPGDASAGKDGSNGSNGDNGGSGGRGTDSQSITDGGNPAGGSAGTNSSCTDANGGAGGYGGHDNQDGERGGSSIGGASGGAGGDDDDEYSANCGKSGLSGANGTAGTSYVQASVSNNYASSG